MTNSPPGGVEQRQSLLLSQRLLMTPQMRQALYLLQLPVLELSTLIEQEVEKNPALEYDEEQIDLTDPVELDNLESSEEESMPPDQSLKFDEHDFEILHKLEDDLKDYLEEGNAPPRKSTQEEEKLHTFKESLLQGRTSLFEHLMRQVTEVFEKPEDRQAAELLVGNLDENGFLASTIEEISRLENTDKKTLEKALEVIQTFEPHGVGASSLAESLLIQLRCKNKSDTLAYRIVRNHFEDLIHNRLPAIGKALNCSLSEIRKAVDEDISKLDLHPGASHSHQFVPYITADLFIKQEGEALRIEINNEAIPPLRLNHKYFRLLQNEELPKEARDYIQQKLAAGKWLLKSLDQRNDTLYKIAHALIKDQREFICSPEGKLRPMTMKEIAKELELHESTIARAVANKYLSCPRGLVPLRAFFTNAYLTKKGSSISSRTVKELLQELLKEEDKKHPLSDDEISRLMKERGIACARRTVSKYRQELSIGSATQRKEFT